MANYRYLFLFGFVLLGCKARKCLHDYVKVNNNSTKVIYFMCDPYFPDSNLNIRDGYANLVNDSSHAKIYPHQSGLFSGHQCAEDIFNPTNGKTMIFIFDANTIENTP